MTNVPEPQKRLLGIMDTELADTPAGRCLLAGKMRMTMTSKATGVSVSIGFNTGAKASPRWKKNIPWWEATHVFVDVNNSPDKVGSYMIEGPNAGWFFPEKNWQTGRITADPVRFWVAAAMLTIAAGREPMECKQYEILQGSYCLRCGAELDEKESIEAGMGPHCREMVSTVYGTRHQVKQPPIPQERVPVAVPPVIPVATGPNLEGLTILQPGESLDDLYERLSRS